MNTAGLQEGFGGAAPYHHQTIRARLLLEFSDIFHHLLGKIHLGFSLLNVLALQVFHVSLLVNGRHGTDALKKFFDGIEVGLLQNAGLAGGLVTIVVEEVPAAEDQIIQLRQGHEVLDAGRARLRAFAQANGAHLGKRADGARQLAANGFNPGNKSGCHGPHAWNQNAQLPLGLGDLNRFSSHALFPPDFTLSLLTCLMKPVMMRQSPGICNSFWPSVMGQFDVEAALCRHMASPKARTAVPVTRLYITKLSHCLVPPFNILETILFRSPSRKRLPTSNPQRGFEGGKFRVPRGQESWRVDARSIMHIWRRLVYYMTVKGAK